MSQFNRIPLERVQRLVEDHGPANVSQRMVEDIRDGHIDYRSLSFRDLAIAFLPRGREFVESCRPGPHEPMTIQEAGDAVDSTAFSNISGQIMYNATLAGFNHPAHVISGMIPSVSTSLNGETIPGLTDFEEEHEPIPEGMPYPEARFGEDYIQTPQTEKRGRIVSLTREAIFFDRTGQIIDKARTIGESLGLNKEKRACRILGGINNNFTWKGTSYNTYLTAGLWINNITSGVELVDWTDVEQAELLWSNMTDPDTGEAIAIMPEEAVLITSIVKRHTARQILNATELRTATDSGANTRITANSVAGSYRHADSVILRNILDVEGGMTTNEADLTWFLGAPGRAFVYMENWPLQVAEQGRDSESGFSRDIVQRFKVSERGVYAVRAPWYMLRLNK